MPPRHQAQPMEAGWAEATVKEQRLRTLRGELRVAEKGRRDATDFETFSFYMHRIRHIVNLMERIENE